MCGIAGILSFNGSPVRGELIRQACDVMAHRGPDGSGLWISPDCRVGLGHRRLSIIDLSKAAGQPMTNEDGSLQIVFNGEIYNHAEIRQELNTIGGHSWRTDHSDTEVILHAYEQWGIECLRRFRGMFAFALWDSARHCMWLVRDRIGIKPLYYAFAGGQLVFASEIKALLAMPGVPRAVNLEALFHYLSFLTAPAPQTLFEGIFKLPSATRMRIDADGRVMQERYWDVWENGSGVSTASEGEITSGLLSELRTSVRYRKVSDVPVGVFLSGGIDSTVNAALFSEGESAVHAFTIGYEDGYGSYASEVPFAKAAAAHVGAEHHVKVLTVEDMLEFVQPMVYHQDEPIGDVVCVPLYYVAKLAREAGVIVCQVGEGADELFCGYPSWKTHLRGARLNALPIPRVAKRAGMAVMDLAGMRYNHYYEFLRRAVVGEPTFFGGAEGLTHEEKLRLLSPDVLRGLGGCTSGEALAPIRRRFLDSCPEPTALNWMTYLDLNLRLPELLLMRVDKMTMATSLEGRVPFLDHKFVEFAMSISTSDKLGGGKLKHLLKRSVRGLIPDSIIDRPKQGFGVPLHEWLTGRLGDEVQRTVERFAHGSGLLHVLEVRDYLRNAQPSKAWQLFNLALWYERFIEGARPA